MAAEKFQHLDNKKPDIKSILDTPVHLVHDDHLGQLGKHFEDIKLKHHLDQEVSAAADIILNKIYNIVNLTEIDKKKVSGAIREVSQIAA